MSEPFILSDDADEFTSVDAELALEPSTAAEVSLSATTDTSIVPPESAGEEVLAAAANAIPAVGAPVVVDPYAVSGAMTNADSATATYLAPTYPGTYSGAGMPGAPTGPVAHQGIFGGHSNYYPTQMARPGQPGQYHPGFNTNLVASHTDGFAITALVCALAGIFIPIIGPMLGLIFGLIALQRIRDTGARGRGLAIAGIVLGAAGLLFGLLAVVGLLTYVQTVPDTAITLFGI
jgi:hypothetical protein